MDNNSNKEREKIITFILGALLIIVVLAIIAIFSGAIMRLLGFEYESVGGFILYFIIASVVSYPINLRTAKANDQSEHDSGIKLLSGSVRVDGYNRHLDILYEARILFPI